MFKEKYNEENNQIHHLTDRTLAGVGMMFAQAPVVNIDRYRHGNLQRRAMSFRRARTSTKPNRRTMVSWALHALTNYLVRDGGFSETPGKTTSSVDVLVVPNLGLM